MIRIAPAWISGARYSIHFLCLAFLGSNYYWGLSGQLSGDPVQALLNFSGISTLNLLLLTLLVSPLAQLFRFAQLMKVRKTLGVYAAVFALFHFYIFIAYELRYEWSLIVREIVDRPYITVGFLGLLILTVLLVTSLDIFKRQLKSRWQKIHNFIYLAVALGTLHFLWSVKSNITEPMIYISAFAILILMPKIRRQKLRRIFS